MKPGLVFLIAAAAALAGCGEKPQDAPPPPPDKKESPAAAMTAFDPTPANVRAAIAQCTDCKWDYIVKKKDMRVERVGCENEDGTPHPHCHLATKDYVPERIVNIALDPNTDAYHFTLVTKDPNHQDERMDCPNLALDYDDDHIIRGTCVIYDNGEKPRVHYFKATVQPKKLQGNEPEVVFRFRHRQFVPGDDPVHNGEGHSHPD